MDTGLKQGTSRSKSRGWFYECRVRKPTLASVFSFGWGQTLALLVACQHITGTIIPHIRLVLTLSVPRAIPLSVGTGLYIWALRHWMLGRLQHQYHYQTGRGWLVECRVRKPTLASVFIFYLVGDRRLLCLWPVNI